jgi:Uri superfamily endonuclease
MGPTFTPALDAWPDAGVYQLWIELRRSVKVGVGALGVIHFVKGMYIYTGRAARGLRARVLRHTRGAVRLHWHIDYLLAQRNARVERVILASTDPDDECRVNVLQPTAGSPCQDSAPRTAITAVQDTCGGWKAEAGLPVDHGRPGVAIAAADQRPILGTFGLVLVFEDVRCSSHQISVQPP